MKFRVLVIGKDRQDPLVAAAGAYLARLQHYYPVELVELKETPVKTDPARARRTDGERILNALNKDEILVLMDERGKELTSLELAERIRNFTLYGPPAVAFAIGGATGFDPQVRQKATQSWALSRLTLPHRFARLLLLEQLYRAATIIRGESYHK